jgi:hypothetical protein
MNDNDSLDECQSCGVEECSIAEISDDALEAAADGFNGAFSLNSIGIVAPNCC